MGERDGNSKQHSPLRKVRVTGGMRMLLFSVLICFQNVALIF